ncbi:hypothetical protein C8J56DRAFT_1058983 [Mycena floridula]|nr:hypothetical protein C8J56DRAFT_1058983 [Mycena floridula]
MAENIDVDNPNDISNGNPNGLCLRLFVNVANSGGIFHRATFHDMPISGIGVQNITSDGSRKRTTIAYVLHSLLQTTLPNPGNVVSLDILTAIMNDESGSAMQQNTQIGLHSPFQRTVALLPHAPALNLGSFDFHGKAITLPCQDIGVLAQYQYFTPARLSLANVAGDIFLEKDPSLSEQHCALSMLFLMPDPVISGQLLQNPYMANSYEVDSSSNTPPDSPSMASDTGFSNRSSLSSFTSLGNSSSAPSSTGSSHRVGNSLKDIEAVLTGAGLDIGFVHSDIGMPEGRFPLQQMFKKYNMILESLTHLGLETGGTDGWESVKMGDGHIYTTKELLDFIGISVSSMKKKKGSIGFGKKFFGNPKPPIWTRKVPGPEDPLHASYIVFEQSIKFFKPGTGEAYQILDDNCRRTKSDLSQNNLVHH